MRVFISSTFKDARKYRDVARREIVRSGHSPILVEDIWGTTNPRGGTELVVRELEDIVSGSDVFVHILGQNLGAEVPGMGKPWIVLERDFANSRNIPILVYLIEESRISRNYAGDRLAAGFSSNIVRAISSDSQFAVALRRDLKALEANEEPPDQAVNISLVSVSPSDFKSLISNPKELRKAPPRFFEEVIAELLKTDGWDVDLVVRANAPGPDIIAMSTKLVRNVSIKMVVECKRWREDRPVDIDVVRKVMYWVNEEYRATLGMIATTSRFTSAAKKQAESLHHWRLDLKDYTDIIHWLDESLLEPVSS